MTPAREAAKTSRAAGFLKKYLYALGAAIFMFTIGIGSARSRQMIHRLAGWFGYPSTRVEPLLPRVKPDEITDPNIELVVLEPEAVDGNVPLLELVVMNRLVRQERLGRIFEIGTFDGRTALNLAANASRAGDGHVYTLDLPASDLDGAALRLEKGDATYVDKPTSGGRFLGTRFEDRITQLFGDSATFDYSELEGSIDMVFIDGSHSYEYVMNDTEKALKLIGEKGGWILWDDYGVWDGVTLALNELYTTDRRFKGLKWVSGTPLALVRI